MEEKITANNELCQYARLSISNDDIFGTAFFYYDLPYNDLTRFINISTIRKISMGRSLDIFSNQILKRGFDIVISIFVIIGVLSWLIPIVSFLIWLDSRGPVFFLQKRSKRNGELFTCIKFRSMIVNTDSDILPASRNDKRITTMGHFLRNYYIDELPQFFNVLMGDMSIIGPRPHMISDNLKYQKQIDYYEHRHKGKPGITGLAQVLGYIGPADNIQDIKDRVALDIFYLRYWSFKLDIIIAYRTIAKIIGLSCNNVMQ